MTPEQHKATRIAHTCTRTIALCACAASLSGCALGGLGTSKRKHNLPQATIAATLTTGETLDISYIHAGNPDHHRLIFIHGTPGDAHNSLRYLTNPIPQTHSISIDRPGFGQTDPSRAYTNFEDQARAIEPFLIKRNNKWPVLVGHSLGGPIVARAAADYPERVGAIVILAGSLDPELEAPRWYNHAMQLTLIRALFTKPLHNSNDEIFAALEQTRALEQILGQVRCPVIIIHGRKDSIVPYENTSYMLERFNSASYLRLVDLPKANHFLPWKNETEVREAINTALDLAQQSN